MPQAPGSSSATFPVTLRSWREVKVYQAAGSGGRPPSRLCLHHHRGAGRGLQIIDLSDLPASISLANTLTEFGTSHTLYISNVDYASNGGAARSAGFLYIAGSNLASGAFRIYDLADPVHPALVTPPPLGNGYMHDSTSMLITDNRTTQCANAHNPCEVLVDFNENTVDLWDVTEKSAPARLSSTTYPTATYVHSGWPSADQRFIIVHDELDELRRGLNTQIYTLDVGDLRTPSLVTSYRGPTSSTDHNGYTIGNRYYVAALQARPGDLRFLESGGADRSRLVRHLPFSVGQHRRHRWGLGCLSLPAVGHLAGQRHRKRAVPAQAE